MARPVYATIQDMRAAGLASTAQYTDEKLQDILELSVAIIDSLTHQFFGPKRLITRVNGWARRLAEEPAQNKIIELNSVTVVDRDGGTNLIDADLYATHERMVRLHPTKTDSSTFLRAFQGFPLDRRWPFDDKNVSIDAIFGWIEKSEAVLETALMQVLSRGDTTVYLASTEDLEKNDLLFIDNRFWVIANEIAVDADPNATPPVVGEVRIDPSRFRAS